MKFLVLGLLLLEVVSGLTILEAFLRLISGQPALKQLKDFPRCGRPAQIASGGGGRRAYRPPQRNVEAGSGPLSSYPSQTRHQCTTPESCQCSITDKCSYGEGDCDRDEECNYPFVCGRNNCRDFNTIYAATALSWEDCCTFRTANTTSDKTALDVSNQYSSVTIEKHTWTIFHDVGTISMFFL